MGELLKFPKKTKPKSKTLSTNNATSMVSPENKTPLNRIKCLFGFHNYRKVKQIIGEYTMALTWDKKGDLGTIVYDLYFFQCDCCGKRKLSVNGDKYKEHHGVMREKNNWEKGWLD